MGNQVCRYWVRKDVPEIMTMTYDSPPTDAERWTELYRAPGEKKEEVEPLAGVGRLEVAEGEEGDGGSFRADEEEDLEPLARLGDASRQIANAIQAMRGARDVIDRVVTYDLGNAHSPNDQDLEAASLKLVQAITELLNLGIERASSPSGEPLGEPAPSPVTPTLPQVTRDEVVDGKTAMEWKILANQLAARLRASLSQGTPAKLGDLDSDEAIRDAFANVFPKGGSEEEADGFSKGFRACLDQFRGAQGTPTEGQS